MDETSDISEEKGLTKDISMEVQDDITQDYRNEELEEAIKQEDNEYNYDDEDFEDYDDDFEDDEEGNEDEDDDDDDDEESADGDANNQVEKKLDSGNYELESGLRQRQRELRQLEEMQQVKEAIKRENSSQVGGNKTGKLIPGRR